MNIELTDLVISQLKTLGTMMAAGVITAALWNVKNLMVVKGKPYIKRKNIANILAESAFWLAAAAMIPMFLYYCTYGKVTFCAVLGMVIGVFVWKKIIAMI